jgi:ABC-type amino acid transport substrate-binding protein
MKKASHVIFLLTLLLASFSNVNAQNKGLTYGVFIAIDGYSGNIWTPLKNPVSDAKAIVSVLNEKYEFDQILMLYDEAATRKNVLDRLDEIATQLEPNDRLLIFYSGHGIEIEKEGYWVPYGAVGKDRSELIPNSVIKTAVAKTKCRHVLLIVDASFGGTTFKSSDLYIRNEGGEDYYEAVEGLISREGLTSGNLEPFADKNGSHSVFMKYVLKFLERNENQYISTSELFELIKYPIAANSPTIPEFGHIQDTGHEGGQFVFTLKNYVEAVVEPVYVEPIPDVDCSSLKVEIEEGKKVTFKEGDKRLHALSSNSEVTYQWFEGVNALTVNSPILEITKSGEYTIVITDKYKCSKAATVDVTVIYKNIYINIEEGSNVEFVQQGTLTAKTNMPSAAVEWRCNNFIVGTGLTLDVREEGIYTINLKSTDGQTIASVSTKVVIKERTYIVQMGDDVKRLARKFYNDENKKTLIINANASIVENNGELRVGEQIFIPQVDEEKTASKIKIGAIIDLAPLSAPGIYQNGILTDISVQVFKEMNMETSIEFMPLNKVKAGVYNGLFTVAQPFAKTPIEELSFYFSEPLYKILNVFFVKADSEIDYTKDKDLKGKKIAVTKGVSIKELDALVAKRTVNLVPALTLEIAFQMLEKGEVDMVAAPQEVGLITLQSMTTVETKNFKMLEKEIGTEELFLVISKNHPNAEEIIKNFNIVFSKLKNSGEIDKLINRHLDKYQKP